MEILIVAVLISSISIYGALAQKRLFFKLGYFLFSILAVTSLVPSFDTDPLLSITTLALMLTIGILSFPGKTNLSDYTLNEEAKGLVKSFQTRTLLSLSVINLLAVFIVKWDPNMPEGITENMRIIPMIMHGILGILPLYVLLGKSKIKP